MAYFNNKEVRFKPRPIPTQPGVYPPDVPTPTPTQEGSTPIVTTTFTGDTNIHLYVTNDARNKLEKVLSNERIFNIYFEDTSVINPVFYIESSTDLSYYNILYIEQTQRYYFIENVELFENGRFKVYAVVDVLMSFKNYILNTVGIVDNTATSNIINKNLPDKHYINSSGKNIKILETQAPTGKSAFGDTPKRILVVSGKGWNVEG